MNSETVATSPLILAFVDDLLITSKIENVARHLGYRVTFLGETGKMYRDDEGPSVNGPGEPVYGPEAALIENLTRWQPALLMFDLGNGAIPWQRWLGVIKSSPATRRIPVICFGPHVNIELMTAAKELSADAVLARSRFVSSLPQLIEQYARANNYEAVAIACQEATSELAEKGLEAFNQGEFFESHEWLEDAWNQDGSAARELYRAILQVAVAYLQIERENYAGAVKMFLRVRQWLEPLPDTCRGIDVATLKADAHAVYQALLELGPDRVRELDRSMFKPIRRTGTS